MVNEQKDYGDKVADVIDQEIEALVNSSYNVAKDILTGNTAKLKQVAAMLIAEETIEGKSLDMLFDEPVPSTGAQVEQG